MRFWNWTVGADLPLEVLNGACTVSEIFFLGWMAVYLFKESRRRKLTLQHWLRWRLPPSMNFVVAVVVFDIGVWVRSADIWVWRRFTPGAGFGAASIFILTAGALLIILGSWCKVRSITVDYGQRPWLFQALATLIFIGATLWFR